MSVLGFWLLVLLLYALISWLGRRVLIPIVAQLLVASLLIPALLLLWVEPHWHLSAARLLAPAWVDLLYSLCFALLLGYILGDVIDVTFSLDSLKIALPSFLLPLLAGVACSFWILPGPGGWLSALAVGLLFSITAIPVLYLFLHSVGYCPSASKRLLHAAILMDFMCWSLFALAQGSSQPLALLWPVLGACLPLLMHSLRCRHPLFYSLPLFAGLLLLHWYHRNALVFGILYLLCLGWLSQPLRLPLPAQQWRWLLNGLAVPLILTCGVLRVDFHEIGLYDSWLVVGVLLGAPPLSKVLGSWLGLHWAARKAPAWIKWRESLLLNIRGLTEIVFLNLLMQLQLIDGMVYFCLLLMSLCSTLLPVVLRWRSNNGEVKTVYESAKH
jgi:hypothetical protein